ncbi:MAG TPA: apolipoprotein N-acyltransferase, partial [Zeimonas sp.]
MRGPAAAPIALALVAGFAQAASFWPFEAWWLQLAALASLVVLVLRSPPRAFALGLAFGLGWFLAGISWLYVSMHRYGGMPAVLAALALLLFAAYLASFFAIVCAALARVDSALGARRAGTLPHAAALALLFAGAWSIAEILRGWLFTGFPWLAIGYAQLDGPLDAFAPLLGAYGVCLFAALVAFGIALFVGGLPGTQRSANDARVARAFGAGIAVLPIVAGLAFATIDWSSTHGAPLRVRLLQGNVAQDLKFDPRRSLEAMYWYANEVLRGDAPLTVLPETAWTIPWGRTPQDVHEAMVYHLQKIDAAVAIGMPLVEDEFARRRSRPDDGARALTNSVGVIDETGTIAWRYDKRHLVPFGEFVP